MSIMNDTTPVVTYAYEVNGGASDGQTWRCTGEVSVVGRGSFMDAVDKAMSNSFKQLTDGRAVYGKPGVGCSGPYWMQKLLIEEKSSV